MNTGVFKPFVRVSKLDCVPSDDLLMIWIFRFAFLYSNLCFFDDLEISAGQKLRRRKQRIETKEWQKAQDHIDNVKE